MAFIVNEQKFEDLKNGQVRLSGTIVNTAGSTGGAITPGTSVGSGTLVTGSAGFKKFTAWGFSNQSAQRAPQVVKSYDTTQDGDILTVTTNADDDYDFWIEGPNNGTYTFG